jgi:DNA-binding response OmpR family regulator
LSTLACELLFRYVVGTVPESGHREGGDPSPKWRWATRKHILFIDDDALLRRLVHDMLEHEGYLLTLASSGAEGLASARGRPPDLILLDLVMPGMDGFEVCREIRRDHRLSAIPVVMLTAMKNSDLNKEALTAGADLCVRKPFRPDTLIAAVTAALQAALLRNRPKEM